MQAQRQTLEALGEGRPSATLPRTCKRQTHVVCTCRCMQLNEAMGGSQRCAWMRAAQCRESLRRKQATDPPGLHLQVHAAG